MIRIRVDAFEIDEDLVATHCPACHMRNEIGRTPERTSTCGHFHAAGVTATGDPTGDVFFDIEKTLQSEDIRRGSFDIENESRNLQAEAFRLKERIPPLIRRANSSCYLWPASEPLTLAVVKLREARALLETAGRKASQGWEDHEEEMRALND